MSLSPQVLDRLNRVSTATVTTQLFKRGLRNTFLFGVMALNPTHARFVGEAFTLRYIPAREDLDVLSVFSDYEHPQRKAIEQTGTGQVLVVDCRGDASAAAAGEILITRLMRRGAAGIVTDGSFRDSPGLRRMSFPVFATGVSAMTNLAKHHAVDLQVPIGCAGVPVYPGDVVMGDEEGVVCIPRELADEVAEQAEHQERHEEFILSQVEEGAPLRGTYPPDDQAIRAYEQWQRSRGADVPTDTENH